MKTAIRLIARALFRAGGPGLLALGIVDSSPLVIPLGNDLLLLALSARHHERVPYFVLMATVGSMLGCLITDWLSRKSQHGLKEVMSARYFETISFHFKKRAGATLVLASLIPPPFPFTAIVAVAAAFRYPRKKLLGFVGLGRFMRFAIEGVLAIHYGHWIVRQAESPILEHVVLILVAVSIVGSVISALHWSHEAKVQRKAA